MLACPLIGFPVLGQDVSVTLHHTDGFSITKDRVSKQYRVNIVVTSGVHSSISDYAKQTTLSTAKRAAECMQKGKYIDKARSCKREPANPLASPPVGAGLVPALSPHR